MSKGKTPDEILADIEADSKIDQTNLDGELTRIPYLQGKWMKVYIGLNKELRKAERIHASLKLDRSNYFMGLAPESVYKEQPLNRKVLKSELAEILAHNRDEEKEHAAMVLEWIRRRDPVMDEQLKKYLFSDQSLEKD